VCVTKKPKSKETKLGIPQDHSRRWTDIQFALVDGLWAIVLSFKLHQNPLSGYQDVGEGSKFDFSQYLYNSLTTIQTMNRDTPERLCSGGMMLISCILEWFSLCNKDRVKNGNA